MRYHGSGVGNCRSTGAVALNEVDDLAASIPTITEECQENDGEPFEAQVADKGEAGSYSPSSSGSDETGSLFEDDKGVDSCDVD